MHSTYIQYEDKIRPNSAKGVALPSSRSIYYVHDIQEMSVFLRTLVEYRNQNISSDGVEYDFKNNHHKYLLGHVYLYTW